MFDEIPQDPRTLDQEAPVAVLPREAALERTNVSITLAKAFNLEDTFADLPPVFLGI
jgi:hypothetical protein